MIEQLIVDISDSTKSHIGKLPAIKNKGGVIKFKRGLNILVGANGSGKTSILEAIADQLGAEHTGASRITQKWAMGLNYLHGIEGERTETGIKPKHQILHDGQPILYANPKKGIGVTVGGVDDELGSMGALEVFNMSSESSGEQSNRRLTPYLNVLQGLEAFPSEIRTTMNFEQVSSFWVNRAKLIMRDVFSANIERGQPTVMLDEPESALGLMNQILLWEKVLKCPDVAEKFQIILVSHSHVCLNIEGANYIELQDGYLEACRGLLRGDLSMSEVSKFATNLPRDLNKRELTFLRKLAEKGSEGLEIKNDSKTLDALFELGLVEVRRKRIRTPAGETLNRRQRFSGRFIELCFINEKGSQRLNLQSK